MARRRIAALPQLLERKIYKTGQTRGADDDEIYQNRVLRNSTVLIPYRDWALCRTPLIGGANYEAGFIVLISPDKYFGTTNFDAELAAEGLELGKNAVVFYEKREHWNAHNPEALGWQPPVRRTTPVGGKFVARVSATTAEEGTKINKGFTTTGLKGAGIRVYEYASTDVINYCRLQLEALFWRCPDADTIVLEVGMTTAERDARKLENQRLCDEGNLLDLKLLQAARAINRKGVTICPLCLEVLSAKGFMSRMEQAEGREVHDLTITQVSLFHIKELRVGVLNHCPYNVAWGHHHCNVVVKDAGIAETLKWLKLVLERNIREGLFPS